MVLCRSDIMMRFMYHTGMFRTRHPGSAQRCASRTVPHCAFVCGVLLQGSLVPYM